MDQTMMNAGQGQQPATGADAAAQPKKVVCIAEMSDGSFEVYSQQANIPAAAGMSDGDMGKQPAGSLDEALDMASQMLGGAESGAGQDDTSADALFQAGFDKNRAPAR